MKFILITFLAVAISFSAAALDCTDLPVAFYCQGTGFALCLYGTEYDYTCGAGTACQCGEGVECDTPCTMACETGDTNTAAFEYCSARLGYFSGQQGYFCDALGAGFYQCVRDAYCPDRASPQSQYISCPDGTECACGDTTHECSMGSSRTPCLWPSDYVPLTSGPLTTAAASDVQTPHQASLCGDHRWDCINFSQGDVAFSCHDDTCGEVGDGGYCFWDLGSNAGSCAGNFYCADSPTCTSDAACGAGNACIINSCCGTGGVCAPICSQ